jgi:hypothetical protein
VPRGFGKAQRTAFVAGPPGWRVRESAGPHGFVTRQVFEDERGRRLEWTSRRHRKGLGLRVADEASVVAGVGLRDALAYHGLNWWIGWLFMIGSACFAVGSMPVYATHVDPGIDGVTFFVGSLFFTSAALLQHIQTVTADRGVGGAVAGQASVVRLLCEPGRIDWWATGIQLVGTLWFNVTTYAALNDSLDYEQEIVRVWTPDALGSICFLVASYLALAEVTHGVRLWDPADTGWRICAFNMVGSIFFGISAVASFILPGTGNELSVEATNLFTFLGAVCFLRGAWLLLPEAAESGSGAQVD